MENVLNTVKTKVKTTKVLAIIGAVLLVLGLFFNVGKLSFKIDKDKIKAEVKESAGSYYSDAEIDKMIDSEIDDYNKMAKAYSAEDTSMIYWGGYLMLILAILAVALVFIDFIEKKIPADTIAKITFWNKLKNIKMVCVPAIIILVILVVSWKIPLKKSFGESVNLDYKEVNERLDKMGDYYLKAKYSIGAGFVLIFLGSAALIAYPFVYKPEVAEATPVTEATVENKQENA